MLEDAYQRHISSFKLPSSGLEETRYADLANCVLVVNSCKLRSIRRKNKVTGEIMNLICSDHFRGDHFHDLYARALPQSGLRRVRILQQEARS